MKALPWVCVALFVCGCGQSASQGGLVAALPAEDAGSVVGSDAAAAFTDAATTVGADGGQTLRLEPEVGTLSIAEAPYEEPGDDKQDEGDARQQHVPAAIGLDVDGAHRFPRLSRVA